MAEAFNYHVNLWPAGGAAPTYLCLLCPVVDLTHADIQTHVSTVHTLTPVPTPLAASVATQSTRGLRITEEPDHAPIPDLSHGNR